MMLPKRVQGDEGDGDSANRNKRRQLYSSLFKGVKNARTLQDYVPILEPLIRKMVKEGVAEALDRIQGFSSSPVEHTSSRSLQLQFSSRLPSALFTGSRIVSEDGSPLRLFLWDSISKVVVTSGPLSSTKVNIVALDSDFDHDDQKGWSKEDFDRAIVQNRVGKRPLLTGELSVSLLNGEGQIGELNFTDNSSWTRSGKFRLGAKANLSTNEVSIREASTNSFKIKDHRGESYQKRHPPSLDDEVWRLEKIAKDGVSHRKLMETGVNCVRDFLRLYATSPNVLRSIFGNISNKNWNTITKHAGNCILDDQKFMYMAAPGKELFFNSVFKVEGVRYDGQFYHPVDTLDALQMRVVEGLKQHAYKNVKDWVLVSDSLFAGHSMLATDPSDSFAHPNLVLPDANFHVEQDQLEIQPMDVLQPTDSSPLDDCEVVKGDGCFETGNSSQMQVFNSAYRNSSGPSAYSPTTFYSPWTPGCIYSGSPLAAEDLPVSNDFQVNPPAWQGQGQGLLPGSNNHEIGAVANSGIAIPRVLTPRTRWCKLLSVVKWRILVKRSVAARKWKQFFDYKYDL